MELPDDIKYTKDHEWIRIDGDIATVGITDYAQEQLGDIVFVELPNVGEKVEHGDTFGAVESVKSVGDCYAPVAGEIVEVNDLLVENPEIVNEDCYGDGWMVKIKMKDKKLPEDVLTNVEYEQFISEESK